MKYFLQITMALVILSNIYIDASFAASSKEVPPLIQDFTYDELPEKISGCSCTFYVGDSENKIIFISDMGKKAWMKIDGKLTKLLKNDSQSGGVGEGGLLGGKVTYQYKAEKTAIIITTEITSECPKEALECEGETYKASFTAIKDEEEVRVEALGRCGC